MRKSGTTQVNMMGSRTTRAALRAGAMLGIVALTIVAIPGIAGAASASDDRATFVGGNATTCAAVSLGSDIQMGSGSNSSNSDANVSGTVKTNAGSIQTGQGEEVNVAITPAGVIAGVVIDAVVVKGGPAYNVYSNSSFLPPTLAPDQHYISPFDGGGNVPTISHWFVCYHLGAPATGSLSVVKTIVAPDGIPVDPLPSSYSATVNCNDGTHTNISVTFGAAGGAGTPASITGLANGTVCTVVENTGSLPAGTVVSYTPSGADTPGVTIGSGPGVIVNITNDYSNIAVERGSIQVAKAITRPTVGNPVNPIPASFTAHVSCDDGTAADVTLPGGTGGNGTPIVSGIKVGALCTVVETTVIDSLATKSYSPVGVNTAGMIITSTGTVVVTITNNYQGVVVSPADVVVTPVVIQPSFAG